MKCVVALIGLLFVNGALACDEQSEEFARNYYSTANQLRSSGAGSVIDVNRALNQLTEARYCSGSFTKETYCKSVVNTQLEIVQECKKKYETGLESGAVYSAELKELNRIKAHCKGIIP